MEFKVKRVLDLLEEHFSLNDILTYLKLHIFLLRMTANNPDDLRKVKLFEIEYSRLKREHDSYTRSVDESMDGDDEFLTKFMLRAKEEVEATKYIQIKPNATTLVNPADVTLLFGNSTVNLDGLNYTVKHKAI